MDFFRECCGNPMLMNMIWAALLASAACGITGALVVARRSTYIAGAVSHSVLAGIGFARYASAVWGWTWLSPSSGALAAAVISALAVVATSSGAKQRTDTVLSAIWASGMALGLAFMSATPGYQSDLMAYLFGSISLVSSGDLLRMAVLDMIIIISLAFGYRGLLAICFNRELAKQRGVLVGLHEAVFAVVVAVSVVILARIVGVVLVIALLALPAAAAGMFTRRLIPMMALGSAICAAVTIGGLAVSYTPEWAPGATIALAAAGVYAAAAVICRRKR